MNSSHIRCLSVLSLAAVLALVQTAHGQRVAKPNPPETSALTPRQGGTAIVPFKIQVPNAVLTDLKRRLSQARFADEFPDAGWDYGMNLAYLKSLIDYWREKYDWRAEEKRLNEFDQFTTNIDGVDIHFVHQRSKNPNAM